jgi:hypothetical protein
VAAVRVVALCTDTPVAATPPNVTVAPAAKFPPLIVIAPPPSTTPLFGVTDVTVGACCVGGEGGDGAGGELPPQAASMNPAVTIAATVERDGGGMAKNYFLNRMSVGLPLAVTVPLKSLSHSRQRPLSKSALT